MDKNSSKMKNTKFNDKKHFDSNNINFRKVLVVFMVLTILSLGFTGYKINEINTRAFQVYLGEESIGVIRSEEEAKGIMEDIKKDLSNTYKVEVVLDNELSFEPTHAKDNLLVAKDDMKASIESKINFLVAGYSLTINDEEVALVKTKEEANHILDTIKEPYLSKVVGDVKEVKFLEEVKILEKEIPLNKISITNDVIEYIKIGENELKTHVVEVGESFWTIAMIYDTSVEGLISANPEKNPDKLKPGDEVALFVPTSKLTVETVEEVEYTENTDFEVVVENDASMYTNQKKVKKEGQEGLSKIVASAVRQNGILVEKNIIKEEVIEAPISELVVKGTKEVPKTMATGIFMMPTRGRLSSTYGSRWGRIHRGIDLAASTGTPIYAADGGKVTVSSYKGSFGNMIEIDHGNGMKTRYAHASKLVVSAGTKVYKGQHIANVGSTGNSTGPHLHFEVIIKGVQVNPSKYVN